MHCFSEWAWTRIVAAAKSMEELRGITLDADSPEIISAIHVALHQGKRLDHFVGKTDGALKHIIEIDSTN